jgi:hypothetical protein
MAESRANRVERTATETITRSARSQPITPVTAAAPQSTDSVSALASPAIDFSEYAQRAANLYGVSPRAAAVAETFLQNIFSAQHLATVAATFPPLHIEFLLDQCQELLGRAIQDRQTYHELAARSFQLKLELEEFSRLDTIHRRERTDGAYTVPYKRAYQDYLAEFFAKNRFQNSADKIRDMQRELGSKYNRILNLRRFMGWLSALPLLVRDYDTKMSYELQGADWNVTRSKDEHFLEMSTEQAELDLDNRLQGLQSQLYQLLASAQAADERAKGHQTNSDWLYKNIRFKTDRLQVAQDLNNQKVRAVTTAGGSLNFSEQTNQVRTRFTSNVQKAWARMSSIGESIKVIYGFNDPLPSPAEPLVFLDGAWTWVQNAIDHIGRYNRFDQNSVIQVSVKTLVNNEDRWNRGLNQTGEWAFTMPQSAFGDRRNVRLRGISINLIDSDVLGEIRGSWSGTITPPTNTRYVNAEGASRTYTNTVKPIWFGRALEWDPVRPADVLGVVSLHNVSPLGEWKVSLAAKSSLHTEREQIGDILLDLHVACRAP